IPEGISKRKVCVSTFTTYTTYTNQPESRILARFSAVYIAVNIVFRVNIAPSPVFTARKKAALVGAAGAGGGGIS
ncbi:MAG: hypothetical protein AB1344_03875, partial [Pseudomonadota bacterium]